MSDPHLRLGSLYNLAGYKDRAAFEYEQFLQKKPDYAERKRLEEYIQATSPRPLKLRNLRLLQILKSK